MDIDSSHVWEAYRALHRYVRALPDLERGMPVPKQLTPTALGKMASDAERIAADLTRLDADIPIAFEPTYYAYLYLFCQMLRCSYAAHPVELQPGQWANIGWFPLHALAGTPGDTKAERAWRKFYYSHIRQYDGPESGEPVARHFPYQPPIGQSDKEIAIVQGRRFLDAQTEHDLDPLDVLRCIEADGKPSLTPGAQSYPWHPWVIMSCLPAWRAGIPQTDARCLRAINLMFQNTHLWHDWWTLLSQIAPEMRTNTRAALLKQLDSFMRTRPLTQRRTWRILRSRKRIS